MAFAVDTNPMLWLEMLHGEVVAALSPSVGSAIFEALNILCASIAYRIMAGRPVHPLHSFLFTYIAYAHPGAISGDLLLVRCPRVFGHATMLPWHCVFWICANFCPGDVFFRVLSNRLPFFILDVAGILDLLSGLISRLQVRRALCEQDGLPLYELFMGVVVFTFGPSLRGWESGRVASIADIVPILPKSCCLSVYLWYAARMAQAEVAFVGLAYFLIFVSFVQQFLFAHFDPFLPLQWLVSQLPVAHCARAMPTVDKKNQ
eukprot:gnl/TRDRNA2_/TRDRNA2_60614_c0_seq1.p1 gnl/TRDRNA2_/TRDRNA2_60614_c0~~gnl/TRDRNA2_/TRDRNA2_60614_c0_seq1.p1  ORF type:complete len:270 (+),score=15.70 gnl/TRDRNA2_/TRDRNA2_60614_c0_seq1:29-811(+)